MKKNFRVSPAILAGIATLYLTQANASAQTITPLNATSPDVINSIPSNTGPNGSTGASGYDFFHLNSGAGNGGPAVPSTNVASLPSYVTNLTFDPTLLQYNTVGLTVGATTYANGGLFYSPTYGVTAAAPQTFLTFQLASGTPSTFYLGVLQNYPDNTVYTLSLYSGTPSLATLLSSTPISNGVETNPASNEFFYGQVSGAGAGDYIVISGAPSSGVNQVTIGGITFDVPEPSTYALMLGGLGILALMARLRRTA